MSNVLSDLCEIARGRTIRHVWPIALVVGTLLTLVNQNAALADGRVSQLAAPMAMNYLTPFVVSSLGLLRSRRCPVGIDGDRSRPIGQAAQVGQAGQVGQISGSASSAG